MHITLLRLIALYAEAQRTVCPPDTEQLCKSVTLGTDTRGIALDNCSLGLCEFLLEKIFTLQRMHMTTVHNFQSSVEYFRDTAPARPQAE